MPRTAAPQVAGAPPVPGAPVAGAIPGVAGQLGPGGIRPPGSAALQGLEGGDPAAAEAAALLARQGGDVAAAQNVAGEQLLGRYLQWQQSADTVLRSKEAWVATGSDHAELQVRYA